MKPCAKVDPMTDYENVLTDLPAPVRRMKNAACADRRGVPGCGQQQLDFRRIPCFGQRPPGKTHAGLQNPAE